MLLKQFREQLHQWARAGSPFAGNQLGDGSKGTTLELTAQPIAFRLISATGDQPFAPYEIAKATYNLYQASSWLDHGSANLDQQLLDVSLQAPIEGHIVDNFYGRYLKFISYSCHAIYAPYEGPGPTSTSPWASPFEARPAWWPVAFPINPWTRR
jgi:hypothetical protein